MTPYFKSKFGTLYNGDVLETLMQLPDKSIDCCITSPPYWGLRNYFTPGQLGMESDFKEYIEKLLIIFTEVYRVLKDDGSCFVNIGDTYNKAGYMGGDPRNKNNCVETINREKQKGLKLKSLCNIPARFAISMTDMGWIQRNEIIWYKPNALCSPVKDRFTVDFEKIFFFTKKRKYYFEQQFEPLKQSSIRKANNKYLTNKYKKGVSLSSDNARKYFDKIKSGLITVRNKRTVWFLATKGFPGNHFAVFPPELPKNCMEAGCPENGTVIDIFMGSGTTALVAQQLNRKWIGIENNPEYCGIITERVKEDTKQISLWEE